ncbi:ATP-binding protein [Cohaesibacter celericrescens]|uniref:ATP-binding protein n=1 Tax=Cohaesibacter celericrescens TaxID=2067669 RepID=UPI0035664DE6
MRSPLQVPFALYTRAKFMLAARDDSEHVAIFMRYVIIVTLYLFLSIGMVLNSSTLHRLYEGAAGATVIFLAVVTFQFLHLLLSPGVSVGRRLLSIANDLGLLTFAIFVLGPEGTGLYPFYFWVILAAGFRYGTLYLKVAALFSAISLISIFWWLDLWMISPMVCFVQVGGIVVLSLAVLGFLHTIQRAIDGEKRANRAKSTFLATISHEVRTPLNAIKGLSDLLGDSKLDREQRRMVSTISESGSSLLTLINHLLDYSRAESGKMPENYEDFDLFVMLGRVYRLFHAEALRKKLYLSIHIDPAMRRLYHGNHRFVEDILINFLSNALKFTQAGHVTLKVSLIEDGEIEHKVRFEVIDTGVGIPVEAQAKIFHSFTQSDDRIKDRFGGSGLGLALCRQYADALGGQITVASTAGKGSCFALNIGLDLMLEAKNPSFSKSVIGDTLDLALVSSDAILQSQVKAIHKRSRSFLDLKEAVVALVKNSRNGNLASLLLIDHCGMPEDVAVVQAQISELGKGATIHVVWICAGSENPIHLAKIQPQHGLAFISKSDVRYRLSKLVRLAANLYDRQEEAVKWQPVEKEKQLKILVADDNRTNQMVIEKLLESLGHAVRLVENGEQALAELANGRFDLVFLDINMPILNGLETSRRFRDTAGSRDPSNQPPMMALTADASPEMALRCEEAGMVACLHKPIERVQLKNLLDEYCNRDKVDLINAPVITPNLKPIQACVLVESTLKDLTDLGGQEFVVGLAHQFSEDGIATLKRLSSAVNECNDSEFRDEAHALRSAAANVGAQAVFDLCLSWRDMSAAELHEEGGAHLRELIEQMTASISALEHHLSITLPKFKMSAGGTEKASVDAVPTNEAGDIAV